jgi:4-hydroxy-2-oxovalerate aldolase
LKKGFDEVSTAIEILDCTLRDGSYPVNYSYTLEDTENICKILESSGVLSIEVGHGMGLGAAEKGFGKSAFSNLDYIEKAVNSLSFSRVGVFAIPGIAEESHIFDAHKSGIEFIRVGTDADKIGQSRRYIEFANSLELSVSLNVMKSYARNKEQLLEDILSLKDLQIDTISIVDSAGTMIPDEVHMYVSFLAEHLENRVGFHGHNNLQLAIANSIAAAKAGATVIDATLRGIGRSSGNAQIEVLAPVLHRLDFDSGVDYLSLSEFSDLFYVHPYPDYGVNGVELACGVSGFHSSFLPTLIREANTYKVDTIDLINRVASVDKINLDLKVVRDAALALSRKRTYAIKGLSLDSARHATLKDYINEISLRADKFALTSILTVSPSDSKKTQISGITQHAKFLIGHVEISESDFGFFEAENCAHIQKVGIDEALVAKQLKHKNLFVYSEDKIVELLLKEIIANMRFKEGDVSVEVIGDKNFGFLEPQSYLTSSFIDENKSVIIVSSVLTSRDKLRLLGRISSRVIFLHSRYVPADLKFSKDIEMYRLDYRDFFDLNIIALAQSGFNMISSSLSEVGGVMTVSGGLIAPRGTIVLDGDVESAKILGVASGTGALLSEDASKEFINDLDIVNRILLDSRLRLIRSGD